MSQGGVNEKQYSVVKGCGFTQPLFQLVQDKKDDPPRLIVVKGDGPEAGPEHG